MLWRVGISCMCCGPLQAPATSGGRPFSSRSSRQAAGRQQLAWRTQLQLLSGSRVLTAAAECPPALMLAAVAATALAVRQCGWPSTWRLPRRSRQGPAVVGELAAMWHWLQATTTHALQVRHGLQVANITHLFMLLLLLLFVRRPRLRPAV